jgi:hypothetical protein
VVPIASPVTIPVAEPTTATAALEETQVPPPTLLVRVMVDGIHTTDGPEIEPIVALMVITLVAKQPTVLV